MIKKSDVKTDYQKMVADYEERGLRNYKLFTAADVQAIHGYDLKQATGYDDLTDEQKELYEAHVIQFLNNHGLNERMVMCPHSVHFVREVTYSKNIYDTEEQEYYDRFVKCEVFILKADGSIRKWKTYKDPHYNTRNCNITRVLFLRVDWTIRDSIEWVHVLSPTKYF
ncbi:MAG: hypothetical protein K5879_03070 [Lachnospiraceae bacterium]|nr:hypothetical protein [Lachnospiraceae bacterium]